MRTVTANTLHETERFLRLNARLIDRLRFEHHFRGRSADDAAAALAAYRNPDGGYGNALEPDLRGTGSQPQHAEIALRLLDELDRLDQAVAAPLCGYLAAITEPGGGVPLVLPSVRGTPAAPWWIDGPQTGGDLNPTAAIAGLLHRHGVRHPWLDGATDFCWTRIAELGPPSPGDAEAGLAFGYRAAAVLTFLEHAPDRARARAEFDRLAPALRAVALPEDGRESHHGPLALAPRPDCLGASLFTPEETAAALDATVAAQQPDGGWRPGFPFWTPITEPEWRGHLTVGNLVVLRAHGRVAEAG
ncbi:hypothetical protein [Allonocardiopsis opalescens]|uniref:Prenyltransferase/squalene oxidase-like repeat protein n=1 Tax=Allonocardiopsis opalescens TaxID=1144618 RepID=A0A2T0Q416_9ACTN|nr:hypothetical protein [Allonocardiopsis opalescens]PRX98545.1 hypothetical protein CLV72_104122 [Allonocardiopsis opalescens]